MFRRAKKARAARRLIHEAPGAKILEALQIESEYTDMFNAANLYAWDVCSDETKARYSDPKNLAPPDKFTIDLFRTYAAAAPPPDEILKALSN